MIVIDCQIPANVLIVPCIFSDFEILVLKRIPMRQGIKSDMKKITDAGDNLCQKIFLYNYGHIIRCGDNSLPVFYS